MCVCVCMCVYYRERTILALDIVNVAKHCNSLQHAALHSYVHTFICGKREGGRERERERKRERGRKRDCTILALDIVNGVISLRLLSSWFRRRFLVCLSYVHTCVAVSCSVVQCVAVSCSVLQCGLVL